MSIFGKIFGKSAFDMVDVKKTPQEDPFITKKEREKNKCTMRQKGLQNTKKSPFLDDCDV